MTIENRIARLHAEYQLFSSEDFKRERGNILKELSADKPNFGYLSSFYENYGAFFGNEKDIHANTNVSRSRDLPFLGESAIMNQKVKFIFYFEGSLSDEDKLSITVLVHLWLTNEESIVNNYFPEWWRRTNYNFVKDKLNISKEVIQNSFVTDAVRFTIEDKKEDNEKITYKSDDEKNSELISKEIELLNPQLVICIGWKAKDLVGMKYREQNTKFHFVPFPSFQYKKRVEKHNDMYEALEGIFTNFH